MAPLNRSHHLGVGEAAGVRSLASVASAVAAVLARAARDPGGTMPYPPGGTLHSYNGSNAGHKCMWSFGVAQCALLYLPRGRLIVRRSAAAIAWAEARAEEANGEPLAYTAFNPAAVDEHHVLLRVTPDLKMVDAPRRARLEAAQYASPARGNFSTHLVLLRGQQIVSHEVGEDPRGVWLDRHSLYAIYNAGIFWTKGARASGRPDKVVIRARNMSDPRSVAVQLRLPKGMPERKWEKNWSPFHHGGRVYLSYQLAPEHIVLSCDFATGACAKAYSSTSAPAWVWLTGSRHDWIVGGLRPRLTSPAIRLRGAIVGIGHFRTQTSSTYLHFFYELSPSPPFEVVRTSRVFRMVGTPSAPSAPPHGARPLGRPANASAVRWDEARGLRYSSGGYSVQFVSGFYHVPAEERVVISYGVGDQSALQTSITVEQVFTALGDATYGSGVVQPRVDGQPLDELVPTAPSAATEHPHCIAGTAGGASACDDSACARAAARAPTLVLCPTLCERYSYGCNSPAERREGALRSVAGDPVAAARLAARLSSEVADVTLRVISEELGVNERARDERAAAPAAPAGAREGRSGWFADAGRRLGGGARAPRN